MHTQKTTAHPEMRTVRLRELANLLLRQIMFLVAKYEIFLEPRWMKSEVKDYVDALSRFNDKAITNLYSYWQLPLFTIF